jgi:YggT family protein
MRAILDVVLLVLQLYTFVIIAAAILSWLIAFNVVNRYNEVVRSIWHLVTALTEPALRPIRGMVPNLGGIDISPVILLLLIFFLERVIAEYIYPYVF